MTRGAVGSPRAAQRGAGCRMMMNDVVAMGIVAIATVSLITLGVALLIERVTRP